MNAARMAATVHSSPERRMTRMRSRTPETHRRGSVDTKGAFALLLVGPSKARDGERARRVTD